MKTDKIIGLVTITAALLLIVYVAFAMWWNEKRARNTVLVQFHEMGALQNEDIVAIRGLAIGKVASITRFKGKALVEIDLDEPRIFRTDTKFKNISPNIMGSRFIIIEPGKNGKPAPEDHIFDGEFEAGFAEILALSDLAKEQIAALMEFVRLLYEGDEDTPSLQEKVEEILTDCEDLLVTLEKALASVDRQAIGALNTASKYAEQISDASFVIDKTLDTIRAQAQDGIAAAGDIVSKIDNTIESLNRVITDFENSPVTVVLLDKNDVIDDIDSLLVALKAFLNSVDRQGIKIYDEKGKRKSMVSLRNINLFGETARSKAKKRAMQEAKK
ncbi:MAG: MlaD family protein [Fibromonadales bacterium]|nr:MlaD family protein [Fibromonadales bacterium]